VNELLGLHVDAIPLFRGVDPDEVRRLFADAAMHELPPDATLIEQGQIVEAVSVLVAGAMRVFVGDHPVNDLGPGACLGEMSIATGEPASATVKALDACRVLRIDRTVFERAVRTVPRLGQNLGTILARRLRDTWRTKLAAGGVLVPVYVTPARQELGRSFASHLAARAAYHVRRPVLLIDGTRDDETSLPGLDALARQHSRIEEHERAAAADQPSWVRITATMTPRVVSAFTGLLHELCALYPVVIVMLYGESPSLAPLATSVRTAFVVLDESDHLRYVATRAVAETACAGKAIRYVQLDTRPRSPATLLRDSRELEREHGCPVRILTLPDAEPSLQRPTPPTRLLDRVTREALGMLVGVALGAGGTRGFAHVGVLETLAKHGVPIDFIAGTSIGSVVGTLWAFGHPPDEIMRMVAATRDYLIRWTVPTRSLLSSRGIREHIEASARGRHFEDSPVPLAFVATDIHTGGRVVLREGKLAPACLASSSIPGVFPAVELDGRYLIDGGICEPVPTATVAELGAQLCIGVTLGVRRDEQGPRKPFGVLGSLLRTNEIMQGLVNDHTAFAAKVVISPELRATSLSLKEFELADEFRAAGRDAVLAALPRLRAMLPCVTAS
jgi:NTE family protein